MLTTYNSKEKPIAKIEEAPDFRRKNSQSPGTDPTLIRIGSRVSSRNEILDRYSKKVNMVSSYTKILINFIQMIAIVESFQSSWPQALEVFFQLNIKVHLLFLQLFNLDCLMKVANVSTLSMPDIFKKVLFYAFLPVVLSFLGVVFWFIIFIRRDTKR